ncbi:hypothetical protein [Micromonospora sp. KC213]|uniref:hypothetical protein n=1 Tax=Micromonospora sp. KC213 TaxID=2530378 RepID=UPI001047B079|nr:hypothetical protein [Micromonospora sp. KC213]TDC41807.1 hypothetical protein E1166_10205 [Micromonospora sp. KC213]
MVAHLEPAHVSGSGAAVVAAPRPRPTVRDAAAVAILLELILVVHDVKTMLSAPYWVDEAWVALSVRLPLGDLPVTTSSSPVGWSFLLRLVPDADHLRVVPLAFHGLAVVGAYAFGRSLRWPTAGRGIVAGVACALVVLLLPAQQVRHDLKQYTADAAVAVCLLVLVSWAEQAWSRRRLGVLTAAVAVAMLVSHVTAIVGPCVFGALLLTTASRRQWSRVVEVSLAGSNAGIIVTAVYLGISSRGRNEAMVRYWADSFPDPVELPGYLGDRFADLSPLVGAPGLVVAGALVAGTVTLVRRERPATALAVVLLPVVVSTLGIAGLYPLLELRTSHFLLVAAAAVAGVGIAGLADLAVTRFGHRLPRARPAVLATAVCALLIGPYAIGNGHWYRFDGNEPGLYYTAISVTDIRSATEYVAEHRAGNDVVVMNDAAWYGFAFYSRREPLELVAPYGNTVGWSVRMPRRSDVVVVGGQDAGGVRGGIEQAVELAGRRGANARVWLIRSHLVGAERDAWRQALADYRVAQVTDGIEPVALVSRG